MNEKKTTQQEINQILWKACDTFRGVVDPSEYKNYILVMLFIKYLSDVYKDTYEKYLEKYSGDKKQVKRMMERERFVLPDETGFDYLYEHRNDTNVGELINIALERIEEANKEKLENVFRNIDFNSEANLGKTKDRNARLKHLLEDFNDNRLDLRPSKTNGNDIIGDSYEYLISRFASDAGKKGGEFYTPSEVATLLAKLLDPQSGDRICDPTCGSGSLLIKVGNEVGSKNFSLYGQESNGSTWALCKMNMFLHGMDSAQIEWGDTVRNPLLKEGDTLMKFDIVVANPPFSLDKWGKEIAEDDRYNRFWRGVPPSTKGDYAFISHMIETLNERGKVGVVVPHGVLFRGRAEERIREKLIDENLLEGVIGLPEKLFYGAGIEAAILVLNKKKTDDSVVFIDASNSYKEGTKQNTLRDSDIDKIVDIFNNKKTVDKYSYVAGLEEIKAFKYNISIPRYVDTFKEKEEINLIEIRSEISEVKTLIDRKEKELHTRLESITDKLSNNANNIVKMKAILFGETPTDWEVKALGDLANISTGSSNKVDAKEEGPYAFFDRSGDTLYSDKYLFEGKSVIVPGEGADFLPKYYDGKYDLHQRAYTIRNFNQVEPKWVYYTIINSQKYLLSMAVGTTVKSLRMPILEKMPIPLPTIAEQKKIINLLSDIEILVNLHKMKQEELDIQRRGLIKQITKGKIRLS